MDIQPTSTQPISDDQELAKVLAGVSNTSDDSKKTDDSAESQIPMGQVVPPVAAGDPPKAEEAEESAGDVSSTLPAPAMPAPAAEMPSMPELPQMPSLDTAATSAPLPASQGSGELDGVKMDAINELRPLVDKLNISPEEKFDTYLLLIRSTDDRALVAPAHEAAKNIADETRRAQALLDIIKEIDFLSGGAQQAQQ